MICTYSTYEGLSLSWAYVCNTPGAYVAVRTDDLWYSDNIILSDGDSVIAITPRGGSMIPGATRHEEKYKRVPRPTNTSLQPTHWRHKSTWLG